MSTLLPAMPLPSAAMEPTGTNDEHDVDHPYSATPTPPKQEANAELNETATNSTDETMTASTDTQPTFTDLRLQWIADTITTGLSVSASSVYAFVNGEYNDAFVSFVTADVKGKTIILYSDASQQLYMANDALPEQKVVRGDPLLSLYLLKDCDGAITMPPANDPNAVAQFIEYGVLPSYSLLMLEHLIKDVFMPLTDPESVNAPIHSFERSERPNNADETKSNGGHTSNRFLPAGSVNGGRLATMSLSMTQSVEDAREEELDAIRSELTGHLSKYASQLSNAIQQVSGSVQLQLPNIAIDNDSSSLHHHAADETLVSTLESSLEHWLGVVSSVMDGEAKKKPLGPSPMAEITFWRDRHAVLSGLYEQLHTQTVQNMIAVMEIAGVTSMDLFKKNVADLLKLYVEAKDNVKFLTTLERHFKQLGCGDLKTMTETIPSMMNSLRMVWIISRHYNKDSRMFPLMERIAYEVTSRVSKDINIRTLFRRQPTEVIRVLTAAQAVLESWHSSYMAMREKIEQSGSDRRWEFNRNKLFDASSYMSKICGALRNVAETIHQFHRFLGPELKAVTGDSQGIDEVNGRVSALVKPIETCPYNIFDARHASSFDILMADFHNGVESIEQRTKRFIDNSFQALRSAEGAFDLLQNFKTMESRPAIQRQMMLKYTDILIQYSREVDRVKRIFEANQQAPPTSRNQPPIAGAIQWTRSLYHRIKKSVLKFKTMPKLLESEEGKQICKEYVNVARAITQYETRLLNEWRDKAADVAQKRLKEFIFKFEDESPMQAEHKNAAAAKSDAVDSSAQSLTSPIAASIPAVNASSVSRSSRQASMNFSALRSTTQSHISNSTTAASQRTRPTKARVSPYKRRKIIINFSSELTALIRETKYLDRMGINVPEIARNVALQETKYYHLQEELNSMLMNYDSLLNKLSLVEQTLLKKRIGDLDRILSAGFDPLNWHSLSIGAFIDSCQRGISALEAMVNSVQKNSDLINKIIREMKRTKLIDLESLNKRTTVLTVEELNDTIERYRITAVEELVKKYKSIAPLLHIIEQYVCETETGEAEQMSEYYSYFEKKIFVALTQCIAAGMKDFESLLDGISTQINNTLATNNNNNNANNSSSSSSSTFVSLPLIKVVAEMNPPVITVTPTIQDMYKLMSKLLRNIPESSKQFVRWMNGQCRECEPVIIRHNGAGSSIVGGNEEEQIVYTFYDDLSKNPSIVPLMLSVTQSMQKVIHSVDQFLEQWQTFHSKYNLWNAKKLAAIERLRQRQPSTSLYDKHLDKYTSLAESVAAMPTVKDCQFVRIDCAPLIAAIRSQALMWVRQYGAILHEKASSDLHHVQATIQNFMSQLHSPTPGIEELKFVLNIKRSIHNSNLEMEMKFLDIQDQYDTLVRYHINVDDSDVIAAASLQTVWSNLLKECESRDSELLSVKQRFKEITAQQIQIFLHSIKSLRQTFDESGPSCENVTLDNGLNLMKHFTSELNLLLKERDTLVLSEKLFDIIPTSFAELYYVEEQMNILHCLYDDIYQEFLENVSKWSHLLWSELEMSTIQRSIQAQIGQMKQMDSTIQTSYVYQKLMTVLLGFKETLPLLTSLKNDSLRERHWKELMKVTCVEFDIDLKTFTLGKLFEMNLYQYKEEILRIVSTAMSEAKIEKDINKINKVWSQQSFALNRI